LQRAQIFQCAVGLGEFSLPRQHLRLNKKIKKMFFIINYLKIKINSLPRQHLRLNKKMKKKFYYKLFKNKNKFAATSAPETE